MNPEALDALLSVAIWLSHTLAAVATVDSKHGELGHEHLTEVTEQNVLLKMKHLETQKRKLRASRRKL
ncbi:MAG: hypothetical protein P8J61_04805 [Gammaproteobacteria bacterium]|nr:hypothetical protein [Gammaproteobacteria bacterium]